MAADFSQDAVLHFLQSRGGSAKNADLLLHFRAFLRDHADRDRNREQFKKFVNSVATVKQEDGVSHVVLRRRFRGFVPGEGAGPGGLQAPRSAPTSADSGSRMPAWSNEKPRAGAPHWRQETGPGPGPGPEEPVLPAAGIILNNNNNNNNLEHHRAHIGPEPEPEPVVSKETKLNLEHHRAHIGPEPEPEVSKETNLNLKHHRAHIGPEPEPEVSRETNLNLKHHRAHVGPGPEPEPGLEVYTRTPHVGQPRPGPDPPLLQQVPEPARERGCGLQLEEEPPLPCSAARRLRHRKSYKSAVSVDDDDDDEEEEEGEAPRRLGSVGGAWPLSSPPLHTARVFSSSPCIMEAPPPSSSSSPPSHRGLPQIFIQDVDKGRDLTEDASVPHSLPLEAELCGAAQRAGPLTQPSSRTPSSHSSIFSSSGWSSCDDLQTGTGDLYDEEAESSDGSASSSSAARKRPAAARRVSGKLRSRLCRSLGADLDQLLQEEEEARRGGGGSEAARLNRLHLISSSLSLRHNLSSSSLSSCSTPPRCLSFSDLLEGTARRRSLPDAAAALDGSTRPSQVPLESREHAWLVKAAAGAWPEIYSLFREDSSLLNRRDFISGFTVLHWIAKHGDHRVLNTLWYGVEKAGLTFDINAQSSCGHTPLHIAAIHNHKNIIQLLVNKFSADLRRRDTAGKRAWQYLGRNAAPDLFKLLGAPLRSGLGLQGEGQHWEPQQPQRRRRRRHHFSSAGAKPLNLTKVKRSSSIAAFLKHKSIQRLTARPQTEAFL